MFQKLKPIDATSAAATDQGKNLNPQTAETTLMSQENNQSSSSSSDVELDGLQRASQNPSTNYSPRPATSTAGFSSFPTARPQGATSPSGEYRTTTGSADGRKLVIGEGINISGEIDACNHLVVEGQVEASLKGANILDIAESGVFFGSVEINEGTVAGRFEGDLKVDGRLTVRSTGVIIGSLSYRELAVESGATIEGKITPLNSKASVRTSNTNKSSSSSSSSSSSNNANQSKRSSSDNELPFATKAAS